MALRFLLDENLRGPLWSALVRHNALQRGLHIDVLRVGDIIDLPLATEDKEILKWCQREERILLSMDYNTMPEHLAKHITEGNESPGVMMLRPGRSLEEIVQWLEIVAYVGNPLDYKDQLVFVP